MLDLIPSIAVRCVFALLLTVAAATTCQAATTFKTAGDIGYFTTDGETVIQRYNFATESWIPGLTLTAAPTAIAISPTKIYLAYGRRLEQMNLDGSNKQFITNTPTDVIDLMLDGHVLFVSHQSYLAADLTSYDTRNGAQISHQENSPYSMNGSSICTASNRIFGRTQGLSPSDIIGASYTDSGEITSISDSSYHGNYPEASRTWCFPNGQKVLDDSGTVYTTSDLTFVASLGDEVDSVGFIGTDTPIALVNGVLVAYSNAIVETGRFTLVNPAAHTINVRGQKIFAFRPAATASGMDTEIVPVSSLTTAPPDVPISPVGLLYDYDQIVSDGNGMLYILSGIHNSIFRWNMLTQRYVDTIPLPESGSRIAFSTHLNRLYVTTPTRRIYRIQPYDTSPQAIIHAQTTAEINLMIPMQSDLLLASNNSWDSNWVMGSNGQLLSSNTYCCYYNFRHFDDLRNLLYLDHTRRTYLGAGQFSNANAVAYGWPWDPVGFSPDGTRAALAAGSVTNLDTAQITGYLSNRITRAGWFSNGTLISLKETAPSYPGLESQSLQKWASNFDLAREETLLGSHADLHMFGNLAVLVTLLNGAPNFTVFNSDLGVVPPNAWEPPVLKVDRFSAVAVDFSWQAIQGETEVILERSTVSNPAWQQVGVAPRDRLTISNSIAAPDLYRYRIRARNGSTNSPYSNIVEVDTRATPLPTVDPRATIFSPDDAFLTDDGRVYMLASQHSSIFVWDMNRQDWLTTIPLRGQARYMSYSPSFDAIFTSYEDGRLYAIPRLGSPTSELAFAEGPLDGTCGLVAADEYLVTCDNYGAWQSQSSFSMSGNLLDTHEWRYPINGGTWSAQNRRVYHLTDNTSPNDLIAIPVSASGVLGAEVESPYHTSVGIGHPVRVSPSGNVVILGPGQVFDANTLMYAGNLPRPMVDAAWMNNRLFSAHGSRIDAHLDGSYALTTPTRTLDRPILRLFAHASGKFVVVLSRADGGTELRLLDMQLDTVEKPIILDGFE